MIMAENTKKTPYISGIVLAAGQASRIGTTKQLLTFRHTTLLGQVIENAANSKLDEIIVVLGHDAHNIQKRLDLSSVRVVINNDYTQGQSTSIRSGLSQVPPYCDAVMFLLGDQPLVDSQVLDTLIMAYEDSHSPIVIPMYEGRRGNPVIIGRSLFSELALTARGDAGARVLFNRHAGNIHFVEMERRCIHVDVDTMEDYRILLAIDKNRSNLSDDTMSIEKDIEGS